MEQINNQNIVKLTDEQLLNFFFTQHIIKNDIYYIQTKVRTYMNEIDASHLIKNKGHKLDMFLGANCQGSNISFDYIYPFFLVAEKYTNNRELWPNRIYSFLNVPDINLSNNDFSGNEWDFATFLYKITNFVEEYFFQQYQIENNSIYHQKDITIVENEINQKVAVITKRLIPNLKNTGLKIIFQPGTRMKFSKVAYEIFEETLLSGKFDGCYVDAYVDGSRYKYDRAGKLCETTTGININGEKLYSSKPKQIVRVKKLKEVKNK